MHLESQFNQPLESPWRITEIGQGSVDQTPGMLRLTIPASLNAIYHDAQVTDYRLEEGGRWRPPLHMTVSAQAQGVLRGTAGFGFWNHPYVAGKLRLRLPQAIWFFFSSPPNNMRLAQGVPGPGWKAATFNARRWQFITLAPGAPLGFLMMRVPALYQRLWPVGQRAIGVSEQLLDPALLNEQHTYSIDWLPQHVSFRVDNRLVHEAPVSIKGPLGFVAWVDNQYAVVTPQGQFGYGLLTTEHAQTLLLDRIQVDNL